MLETLTRLRITTIHLVAQKEEERTQKFSLDKPIVKAKGMASSTRLTTQIQLTQMERTLIIVRNSTKTGTMTTILMIWMQRATKLTSSRTAR